VGEVRLLLLWRTSVLFPVPFLAAVVARVVVVLAVAPAGALLLIARPVLVALFAGARLGAALAGLLVLHPCQSLLLSEQQFAARTHRWISIFILSSFDRLQMTGYLLN
jgi:hypothetical protein